MKVWAFAWDQASVCNRLVSGEVDIILLHQKLKIMKLTFFLLDFDGSITAVSSNVNSRV
jgi:hypothetical protein